jgi:chromate reductase, NAD(P)H dehydrogenase (quinone)
MRTLAISGSLRRGSHNTGLLRAAAEVAPAGGEVLIWDGLRRIPPYDEDLDGERPPEPVRRLRETVAQAARSSSPRRSTTPRSPVS